MRATQFSDLKAMQKLLADQARAEKEAQAAARLAEQQRQREQQLFAFSIGAVKPIKDSGRVPAPPSQVTPRPLQRESDDSAVMAEALSDEFDVTSLLETDDALSYRRSGIGDDVLKKLRGGHWPCKVKSTCTVYAQTRRAATWPISCAQRCVKAGVVFAWFTVKG